MRRLLAGSILLPLTFVGAWIGWGERAAWGAEGPSRTAGATRLGAAQTTEPAAVLTLVSQSPWNGPKRPLDLTFRATNSSPETLGSLSVVLSIFTPARSRSVYELSLQTDATTPFFAYPFPQGGSLRPAQSRLFHIRQRLDVLTAGAGSAIYPLRVQLLSGDTAVATLRTPMIFLEEPPKVPLNLAWTWVLAEPVQFGPDGTFLPGPMETDVGPGGRLDAMIQALDDLGSTAADVVVSPVLADELARMARGYRIIGADGKVRAVPGGTGGAADAARLLAALQRAVRRPSAEVAALPYGDPSLPALFESGLEGDLSTLVDRGRAVVVSRLGVRSTKTVSRAPYSQLDAATAAGLRRLGARLLLLDPNFLPPEAGLKFSPQPVVRLETAGKPVAAVVPDGQLAALQATYQTDPSLAAQVVLGELAAIWLEFPGLSGRGVAVLFPERSAVATAYFGRFASLVRSSPWLRPVTASTLAAKITQRDIRPLLPGRYRAFASPYVGRLFEARASLAQFREAVPEAGPLVRRLQDQLLLSEAGSFLSNSVLGERFIRSVGDAIRGTYSRVQIDRRVVTLASQVGLIPITIHNDSGYPMRVRIQLIADRRMQFTRGDTRVLDLPPRRTTLTFPVRAQTTGRFPIQVRIGTPVEGGVAQTIAQTEMIVRSTAYNRIALVLVIGAAAFLLGWWGRRFLPRRRS